MFDPTQAAELIRDGIKTDLPEKDRVLANALVDFILGIALNLQTIANVQEARARHESLPGFHM